MVDALLNYVNGIPVIDAHEHLVEGPADLDFSRLLTNYVVDDLVAAGCPPDAMVSLTDARRPVAERWATIEPYFNAIRFGGYAQMALRTARGLFGVADINASTVEILSEKIRDLHSSGAYQKVLREKCGIKALIQCWCMDVPGPEYFYHLAPGPEVVNLSSRGALEGLEKKSARRIRALEDIEEAMEIMVARWVGTPRVVGVKLAHAYARPIRIRRRTRAEAEEVLRRVAQAASAALSVEECIPLEDYLVFKLAGLLEAKGFPLVIHTGLQAGYRGRIADSHPLGLQALLESFPELKVDLFHGGMPWVREIGVLARHFPGVHLNMAWMHIICPAQARSALSEWLDSVPLTKIFGFGGDVNNCELVYGHLELARLNIARVLAEKVAEGTMSEEEARAVAHAMIFENPNRFYKLGLKR